MERDSQRPDNSSGRTILIDADSMLYYACGKERNFEEAKQHLDSLMVSVLSDTGCDRYAAFLSDPNSFRKRLGFVREYKGNRKGKETPEILYALKVYAMRNWGFILPEGFEADDCVSLHRHEGIIASPDKDVLRQIEGRHWNYQKSEWVTTSREDALQFLWLQTASGDSVDGIPGIPGIGHKRAMQALDLLNVDDMPLKVLQMYLTAFSKDEGFKAAVDRFKETLDLVYLLRNSEDLRRLNLSMPPIEFHTFDTSAWDTGQQG